MLRVWREQPGQDERVGIQGVDLRAGVRCAVRLVDTAQILAALAEGHLEDHLVTMRRGEVGLRLVDSLKHREVGEEYRLLSDDEHVMGCGSVLGSGRTYQE